MAEPVISARGLRKSYGPVDVLKGIDLEVRAGEFLVLLGPSGSGKSTLLNVLALMDRPTGGTLALDGREASGLDEEERSRLRNARLGFVFQFDALLPEFTILENVLMPARIAGREAQPRARELLERLGLSKLADRFPAQASGGERQRAALCRALINAPGLLLADEPTGNLDKASGELVFSDLKKLAQGQKAAVLMVTHNEAAASYATRVLHMTDGLIQENR
jgi:lipoprotein-releasing system ATP-binding protein